MKYIVVCLFMASLCSIGMVAVAQKITSSSNGSYGDSFSKLFINRQIAVSGVVFQSERGLAITTNTGTYLLKGTDGGHMVGRDIRVTGVIRGESIFAVKADIN